MEEIRWCWYWCWLGGLGFSVLVSEGLERVEERRCWRWKGEGLVEGRKERLVFYLVMGGEVWIGIPLGSLWLTG